MRGFWKLTWVQFKLLTREPPAFFFTLIFPSLLLVFFGSVFGNQVAPGSEEWAYGYVDAQVPAFTAVIIATTALMGIPIATSAKREHGVLRRFRATPMHPANYLASDVTTYFAITLLGMAVLVGLAKLMFGLRFGGSWTSVLGAFSVGCLSFFAMGYVIASVSPTGRVAQVIGQVLYFPLMLMSGATLPLAMMPPSLRGISHLLPLTHLVKFLQGTWYGDPWSDFVKEIALLVGLAAVGVALSARFFRWE